MPIFDDIPERSARKSRLVHFLLLTALLGSFALRLNHLNHPALTPLDESFHAVVARSLLADPLRPALYRGGPLAAGVPTDDYDWKSSGTWLHKPVLPLWQMALSLRTFGIHAWALRLPSAVLATAAAGLTFLIGRRLFNRRVGLIAAVLHAFNPATFTIAQGYIFSDHIDVALLFWIEAGIYFVVRAATGGRRMNAVVAGAAQAAAFLSKYYPGLIVSAVAGACWATGRLRRSTAGEDRVTFDGSRVALLTGSTVAFAAPWIIWCVVHFPDAFRFEQMHALSHLSRDVEQFAGPWDRVVADFSLRLYFVFFPLVITSTVLAAIEVIRFGCRRLSVLLAWQGVVTLVFTAAVSKTPTATLIALPAGWLTIGWAVDRAGCRSAAMRTVLATTAALTCLLPGAFPVQGWGFPAGGGFAGVLRSYPWPFYHAAAGLAAGGLMLLAARRRSSTARPQWRAVGSAVITLAFLWLIGRCAVLSLQITEKNADSPSFATIGPEIDLQLPARAVLLVEPVQKFDYIAVMFWTGRNAYRAEADLESQAARMWRAGAVPFLISPRGDLGPIILSSPAERCWVYALPPPRGGRAN